MAPDDYQQAWRSQTVQTNVTINADELWKEVKSSQQNFQSMIFGRDLVEVGIGLLMLPLWFYWGISDGLPWTWYLTVPAIVWVVGFILIDRKRHPRQPSEPGATLLQCVQDSLAQVEHQIWLLRNVFWWYLLPFTVSIMAFFTQVCWQASAPARANGSAGWLEFVGGLSIFGLVLLGIYGWIYYINQRAVRLQLEPQRQELVSLLAALSNETNGNIVDQIELPVTVSPFAENGFIRAAGGCATPPRPAVRVAIALAALAVGGAILVGAMTIARNNGAQDTPSSEDEKAAGGKPSVDTSLIGLVSAQREKNKLVGLAAMVMVDGQVVESAVVGERKIRSGIPLEIGDRWHLGGITCSITATMIAGLVDSGQMKWTDTTADVFPEATVDEYWKSITLTQLLTNTSGAPINFSLEARKKRPAFGPESTEARRAAVLEMVSTKPAPVTSKLVSAVGPTIAAAMAERVTGDSWSNLVQELVFQPLKLTGAGFGPPRSSRVSPEQPRGHRSLRGNPQAKYGVSDQTDNTTIIGPALSVHMTLQDLCVYGTEHLRGYFREGKLLSTETYKVLHTPEENQYAFGWVRRKPDAGIPYTVYWHNGSNTMWYAFVAFIPEKNMVVAITSNDGDTQSAEAAALEILKVSVTRDHLMAEQPEGVAFPKKSPFAAVRWKGNQPEVKLGTEWFKLLSLDGVSASEIVAFSQRTERNVWRKRFEEDLVELLTRMGHAPGDKVALVVQSLATGEASTKKGVLMTEENRDAIRDAATKMEGLNQ